MRTHFRLFEITITQMAFKLIHFLLIIIVKLFTKYFDI